MGNLNGAGKAERVKVATLFGIIAVVLVWLVAPWTFLALPSRPMDYEPSRHKLVTAVVVQEPSADDYREYEVPGLWFDPQARAFYGISIHDPSEHIERHNRLRRVFNYGVGVTIALVVIFRRLLLSRLGITFAGSVNPPFPWLFRRQPVVRYALLVAAVAIPCLLLVDSMLVSRAHRSVPVGVVVKDEQLYDLFLTEEPNRDLLETDPDPDPK